jgi:GntR family transcriptional regulator
MQIDPAAPEWAHMQVAAQLRAQIAAGTLGPKLPTHMALADLFGVAPKTVQRALTLLKDEGLIYGRPGLGTFVSPSK